jgi:uroporphyrinogen-III synthase
MPPTILITRPDPAAHGFADKLRAVIGCDVPVLFSPLMRIEPCGTMPALEGVETLIFTSRNGVAAFTRMSHRRDIPCYCVGDATAELARAEGLSATSCGGDADRLVARILADKVQGPCLHIRGEHGVGNIAARLMAGGVKTDEAVLYRQVAQCLTAAALDLLHREAPVIIPLFSPRSARLISKGFSGNAPLYVVAISQAVADAVRLGNPKAVIVARAPDVSGMVDAIRAAMAQANTLEGDTPAQ